MLEAFEDIEVNEDIKKDIIIDNLMKSEDVYLIVSPPKVGKSLFALQLANSIANGLPFMGHKTFKSSPVLYITTDIPKKQLIMRANALGITFNKKSFFVIEGDKYLKVNLKDNEYKIKEFVEDYNGKVMIIDMFKDVDFGMSYNINDYQDIAQNLMPIIRNFASKYGLTVLLVHHTNKIGKTLGSIGFDAVVDGTIKLSKNAIDTQTIKMETESRYFPSICEYLHMDNIGRLTIAPDGFEDYMNPNLVYLIKLIISKKELETTIGELLKDPKLFCTPTQLGKLINNNKVLLTNEGITFSEYRTSKGRTYHFEYHEPSLDEND